MKCRTVKRNVLRVCEDLLCAVMNQQLETLDKRFPQCPRLRCILIRTRCKGLAPSKNGPSYPNLVEKVGENIFTPTPNPSKRPGAPSEAPVSPDLDVANRQGDLHRQGLSLIE